MRSSPGASPSNGISTGRRSANTTPAARSSLEPIAAFREGVAARHGTAEAYADRIFRLVLDDPAHAEIEALKNRASPHNSTRSSGRSAPVRRATANSARMNELYARYVAGIRRLATLRGEEGDLPRRQPHAARGLRRGGRV